MQEIISLLENYGTEELLLVALKKEPKKVYVYIGVPAAVHKEFKAAKSHSRYLMRHIKGVFPVSVWPVGSGPAVSDND